MWRNWLRDHQSRTAEARRRRVSTRAGVALVATAALVSACSSSGGSSSSSSATPSSGPSSNATGSSSAVTRLRVAIPTTGTVLPVWIAEQQGIFAKHGLEVTASPVSDISRVPPTLGKQYELTLSTAPNVVKAQIGHLDVVAVSANTINTRTHADVQVIASAKSGIKALKDLEGKTVGVQSLVGNVALAAKYMMVKAGVDVSKIRFVQIPPNNMADQLKADRADAVEAGTPALTAIKKAGGVELGDPFLSLPSVPNLSSLWIASAGWARTHSDVISRWRQSLTDAAAYIKANLQDAHKLEAEKTGESLEVVNASALPVFSTDIASSDFGVWIEAMKKIGAITSAPNPDSLVAGG